MRCIKMKIREQEFGKIKIVQTKKNANSFEMAFFLFLLDLRR